MTALGQALSDYLTLRRRLGYYLERDQPQLEQFVCFLEQAGAERITTELALRWARMPANQHPIIWRRRLSMVRQFARYLATVDPASEIAAKDLLPARQPRVAPYIYSPQEITAVMAAARGLRRPLTAALFEIVIGLMATTGLRLREALALDRADVDLQAGVLDIRAVRNHRQREVVLHPSATAALEMALAKQPANDLAQRAELDLGGVDQRGADVVAEDEVAGGRFGVAGAFGGAPLAVLLGSVAPLVAVEARAAEVGLLAGDLALGVLVADGIEHEHRVDHLDGGGEVLAALEHPAVASVGDAVARRAVDAQLQRAAPRPSRERIELGVELLGLAAERGGRLAVALEAEVVARVLDLLGVVEQDAVVDPDRVDALVLDDGAVDEVRRGRGAPGRAARRWSCGRRRPR
jgi:hypothetical protein